MKRPRGVGLLATARLVIWSLKLGEGLYCPLDEITWLDRYLLSMGSDDTLHRSPRCAGIRYLDHGWELFSHDITHEVYVAPYANEILPCYESAGDGYARAAGGTGPVRAVPAAA